MRFRVRYTLQDSAGKFITNAIIVDNPADLIELYKEIVKVGYGYLGCDIEQGDEWTPCKPTRYWDRRNR